MKMAIAPSRLAKDPTLCIPVDPSREFVEDDATFSLLNAIATPVSVGKGGVERSYHPVEMTTASAKRRCLARSEPYWENHGRARTQSPPHGKIQKIYNHVCNPLPPPTCMR